MAEQGVKAGAEAAEATPVTHEQQLGIVQRCFSEEASDVVVHFQIIKFEQQYYVWVGCNSAAFGSLYAAVPTKFDPQPSVAQLITKGGDAGALMAQRLSKRTGCQIFLACSLPSNSSSIEAFAERRILQEIREFDCLPSSSGPPVSEDDSKHYA
ncbi:hypothetical protein KFL_002940060 [Klebsormidium nitens]|uniref:Proteasome assembly chaperone 4 n=1 Tax=Klebsormidium nitens TaxID=105231 RepID=A0A1Y1I6E1_KLENI|nr:hypothetical protein KFL_002940060 [Klebsormidium nitens]|eukprot:GAQ86520.1 hypothetical protein KFL_002940060 [Klebsormidium nitens]